MPACILQHITGIMGAYPARHGDHGSKQALHISIPRAGVCLVVVGRVDGLMAHHHITSQRIASHRIGVASQHTSRPAGHGAEQEEKLNRPM